MLLLHKWSKKILLPRVFTDPRARGMLVVVATRAQKERMCRGMCWKVLMVTQGRQRQRQQQKETRRKQSVKLRNVVLRRKPSVNTQKKRTRDSQNKNTTTVDEDENTMGTGTVEDENFPREERKKSRLEPETIDLNARAAEFQAMKQHKREAWKRAVKRGETRAQMAAEEACLFPGSCTKTQRIRNIHTWRLSVKKMAKLWEAENGDMEEEEAVDFLKKCVEGRSDLDGWQVSLYSFATSIQ